MQVSHNGRVHARGIREWMASREVSKPISSDIRPLLFVFFFLVFFFLVSRLLYTHH